MKKPTQIFIKKEDLTKDQLLEKAWLFFEENDPKVNHLEMIDSDDKILFKGYWTALIF